MWSKTRSNKRTSTIDDSSMSIVACLGTTTSPYDFNVLSLTFKNLWIVEEPKPVHSDSLLAALAVGARRITGCSCLCNIFIIALEIVDLPQPASDVITLN